MADISQLCLGKPPLRCLSVSSSVSDAITALKSSEDTFLSIWNCNHHTNDVAECECLGKISMADIICHLSKVDEDQTLSTLNASVSVLLPQTRSRVLHVQPSCSLIEAIDLILQGAHNLIVPIQAKRRKEQDNVSVSLTTTHSNGRRFCWITQEDIIQFFLGSIAAFSPLPSMSISELGIINNTHEIITVDYHSSASTAISNALAYQTSVAVVDGQVDDPYTSLVGEISPMTLTCCDETAAAAVKSLSAGDLMAYLEGYSSCDQEFTTLYRRSARMGRNSGAIVCCNPTSSLMAVMIQTIAHRVNYAWVIDKDGCFVGMITFVDILQVFRNFLVHMV